ncbi:MAG: radical SAM protein [Chitinivibrionales bacterium]|nr:radical SAM protein [Chitinivibrionales bacterium]
MNANSLKKIFLAIRSNQLKLRAIQAMRLLGMRHLVVRMDTNFICNLRCKMCHHASWKEDMVPPMEPQLFSKIAHDIFPKARVLYLSCIAEPFCTPQFGDYLKMAKKMKVPFVSITSNCMLLTDSRIEEIISGKLDELVVSFSGGTKHSYEENQRGGHWETVWDNLRRFVTKRERARLRNPRLKCNYILTKESINEIDSFISHIQPLKPDYVTLRELVQIQRMDKDFYNANKLDADDLRHIDAIKRQFMKAGIKTVDSLQCTQKLKPTLDTIPSSYPCIQPWFQIYIHPTATVRFCGAYNGNFGSLTDHTLQEIMLTEQTKTFFTTLVRKDTCTCLNECFFQGQNTD